MKKRVFSVFTLSFLFFSCKFGLQESFYKKYPVEKRATSVQSIDLTDASGNQLNFSGRDTFSFVVISDVHFGACDESKRPDSVFIQKIKNLSSSEKPDFCLCLGDATEHGYEKEYKDFNKNIVDKLSELNIKTYCVVGNHDLYNTGWKNYVKYNYPNTSLYKFTVNGDDSCFSFYGIDSGSGNISEPQFSVLKKEFSNDNNPKIVFSHFPLYTQDTFYFVMQDSNERNKLISLFAKNNVRLYLGGHIHEYLKSDYGSFLELNVPAYLEYKGAELITVNIKNKTYIYKKIELQ